MRRQRFEEGGYLESGWTKYKWTLCADHRNIVGVQTPIPEEHNLRWDGFGTVGLIRFKRLFWLNLNNYGGSRMQLWRSKRNIRMRLDGFYNDSAFVRIICYN